MTRDLRPSFQYLITKSVSCLRGGPETCNVIPISIGCVCYLSGAPRPPPPPRGPRWRRSGHTSFRPVGPPRPAHTHTGLLYIAPLQTPSLLATMIVPWKEENDSYSSNVWIEFCELAQVLYYLITPTSQITMLFYHVVQLAKHNICTMYLGLLFYIRKI
jgi:hypothetical protein